MTGVAIERITEDQNGKEAIVEIIALAKNKTAAEIFVAKQKARDKEKDLEYTYKIRPYRGNLQLDANHDFHAYNIGK